MNIPSKCRIASIDPNHAMILPYDANPSRMEFSERTGLGLAAIRALCCQLPSEEEEGCDSEDRDENQQEERLFCNIVVQHAPRMSPYPVLIDPNYFDA
jgi:hypothetical protein